MTLYDQLGIHNITAGDVLAYTIYICKCVTDNLQISGPASNEWKFPNVKESHTRTIMHTHAKKT